LRRLKAKNLCNLRNLWLKAFFMQREIYVPVGGPPRVEPPSPEIYAQMGEAQIFAMLADFYSELAQSPLRALFPRDMLRASQKSAAFFVGLLGGPPLYQQRYGNPAMRARHLPFVIDEAARQEWLACFERVLAVAPQKYNFPAEHVAGFRNFLVGFSSWMVNSAQPGTASNDAELPLFG
jgi:hemoglobin